MLFTNHLDPNYPISKQMPKVALVTGTSFNNPEQHSLLHSPNILFNFSIQHGLCWPFPPQNKWTSQLKNHKEAESCTRVCSKEKIAVAGTNERKSWQHNGHSAHNWSMNTGHIRGAHPVKGVACIIGDCQPNLIWLSTNGVTNANANGVGFSCCGVEAVLEASSRWGNIHSLTLCSHQWWKFGDDWAVSSWAPTWDKIILLADFTDLF